MSNTKQVILVDPISEGLIHFHKNKKNHRILKVLRTLCLRSDFSDFLNRLREECLSQEEITDPLSKNLRKIWNFNESKRSAVVSAYLIKITETKYYKGLDVVKQDHFHKIALKLLQHSYVWTMIFERQEGLFHNSIDINSDFNYPNISFNVYDKKLFENIFHDAFYSDFDAVRKKYGGHPLEIQSGSVLDHDLFEKFKKSEHLKIAEPKIGVITFDDDTDKTELIDYINKTWSDQKSNLKGLRPPREEKRVSSPAHFLRDIHIYNKYQEFKDAGFKNPDVKVYSWLKDDSEHQIEIEPNTIRKIVSEMNTEITAINKT